MYSFGHMPNEMFKDVLRHVFQCNDLLKTDFSLEEHVGKSIHHPFGEESEKKAFELKKKGRCSCQPEGKAENAFRV